MNAEQATKQAPYGDVDHTEDEMQSRLIRFLDTQNQVGDIQNGKRIVLDELAVQSGWTVLDAGSGLGHDLIALAKLAGLGGRVVGIDSSQQMIDQAWRRLADSGFPFEIVKADIVDLPFEDGTFDAVRSERVFQHLSDIGMALDELIRVTRPGGRIVIFDTDHSAVGYTIGEPEIEAHLAGYWSAHPGAKNICRVPALMSGRGMVDIAIRPQLVFSDASDWSRLLEIQGGQHPGMIGAHQRDIIDEEEYDRLLEAQSQAIENNTFFSYTVMLIVAGTKPAEMVIEKDRHNDRG